MKDDADLALEVVILLLILGIFMLGFGFLLFKIHAGKLSYNPDSTYGLFLVVVSFQVINGQNPWRCSPVIRARDSDLLQRSMQRIGLGFGRLDS